MKYIFRLIGIALLAFVLNACSTENNSSSSDNTFTNPILRGFYPDPSICRVGEDYYMVNSSFEWFPGVPIFHSKDLVNWKQIGHVLDRPEQLNLPEGLKASWGIYAPTLRYHAGKFYMITTCVYCDGNFYVTAENPEGPWSDPVWVNAPGIDPTLFWDDDGTCWYVGAHNLSGKREWDGQNGVFVQRINLETGELFGEPTQLTFGHATNAVWGEGPHIYKIGGRYLLMIAEGGTGFNHAITVFESDSVNGIYVPSQVNPVLTHRHLGREYPISAVGHCDIIQTQTGEWWGVMLAVRNCDGVNLLGRETYLAPLTFENNWPVFNPGIGKLRFMENKPNLPEWKIEKPDAVDEFNSDKLQLKYCFLRTPKEKWYTITDGQVNIKLRPQMLTKREQPSLIAQRITEFSFDAFVELDFTPENVNEEAGFAAIYNNERNYRLVKTLENNQEVVKLYRTKVGEETLVATEPVSTGKLVLGLKANRLNYEFFFGPDRDNLVPIGGIQEAKVNASQSGVDFTGPMIGMYASSNETQSENTASFEWFEYRPYPIEY